MEQKLIEIFRKVQAIPYKCRGEEHFSCLNIMPLYANCNKKRDLLKNLLGGEGFESRDLDAIFDWTDLPIPQEIIRILRNSGTHQKHHLLEIRVNGNYIKIDATWNPELGNRGFPVTKNWDGNSDTEPITPGTILFYDPFFRKVSLPYFPIERGDFAREFNEWLGFK